MRARLAHEAAREADHFQAAEPGAAAHDAEPRFLFPLCSERPDAVYYMTNFPLSARTVDTQRYGTS